LAFVCIFCVIGLGEAEALVLAKSRKALAVLDDKEARAIVKCWNLEYTSTLTVLFEAFERKLVSYDELVEDLAKRTVAPPLVAGCEGFLSSCSASFLGDVGG